MEISVSRGVWILIQWRRFVPTILITVYDMPGYHLAVKNVCEIVKLLYIFLFPSLLLSIWSAISLDNAAAVDRAPNTADLARCRLVGIRSE